MLDDTTVASILLAMIDECCHCKYGELHSAQKACHGEWGRVCCGEVDSVMGFESSRWQFHDAALAGSAHHGVWRFQST